MSTLAAASSPTGTDLVLWRTFARIQQLELARELGVSRQLVGSWESRERPSAEAVRRYLAALEAIVERRRSMLADSTRTGSAASPEPIPASRARPVPSSRSGPDST